MATENPFTTPEALKAVAQAWAVLVDAQVTLDAQGEKADVDG